MSTSAPASAPQPLAPTCDSASVSSSGTPGRAVPVAGSVRMSERFSISSTKYGPSVRTGVTTHCAFVEEKKVAKDAPKKKKDVSELSPPPPQLPKTPTAIIEPSADSAPHRPNTV